MELQEFLEKYTPNYKEKSKEAFFNFIPLREEVTKALDNGNFSALIGRFMDNYFREIFPEALQNFADKICEKQRSNCVTNYAVNVELIFDNALKAIKEAEQPKIDELTN